MWGAFAISCRARRIRLRALPGVGEAAEVYTDMLVSQDNIRLVGFATVLEKEWFKLLQSVQGVGARVALAILSVLSAGELASAIALQDKAMIGRANGVGKKLAERIVLELKDKAPAYTAADIGLSTVAAELAAPKIVGCDRCGVSSGQPGLRAIAGGHGGSCGDEEGRR